MDRTATTARTMPTQAGQDQHRQDCAITGGQYRAQKHAFYWQSLLLCVTVTLCGEAFSSQGPKSSVSHRRNSTLRTSSENVLACSLILSRSGFDASEGFKQNDDLAAEGRQFTAEITKPFWNQHRLFPFIGGLASGRITQLGISRTRNE